MSQRTRDAAARRPEGVTRAAEPTAERVIPLVASTDDVDFYNEVVDQGTWRLARFVRNPVALYQHDRGCEPIGFYRGVRVEEGDGRRELRMELVLYPDDLAPEARLVWGRYCAGGPVPFSVGFSCARTKTETRSGREVRVLYDCELEEVSVVTIPANPHAVAEARRKGLALYRHHHRARAAQKATTMDPFEKLLSEKGFTPETLAQKAGMTQDEYNLAIEGGASEQLAKIAAALELDPAALAEMLGGEGETEVELAKTAPAPKAKAARGAQGDDLQALLGAKTPAEAAAKVKALLASQDEHRELGARLKSLEAQVAAGAAGAAARERDEQLEHYRRKGVLTPARENGKVGNFLKGLKTAAEVKAFLDTLEPVAAPGPAAQREVEGDGAELGERHLKELADETGLPLEDLKREHAALRARPAVR